MEKDADAYYLRGLPAAFEPELVSYSYNGLRRVSLLRVQIVIKHPFLRLFVAALFLRLAFATGKLRKT